MAREWQITSYMPSYKQFSLSEKFTKEQISEALNVQPVIDLIDNDYEQGGEKVTTEWRFFASAWFDGKNGEPVNLVLPCAIWDYKGSKWSGFGPVDAFRQLGLLPPAENEDA